MPKVKANGLNVATSTTGHIAHVLPPGDPRKVSFKDPPVPLWNEVPSSRIFDQFPEKTLFESGKIWVDGTKAGPKSDPIDTWPTPKGAINSWACGNPQSGSKNVIVEARKVFRHTDSTWQNEFNSKGRISDAAEAAKARAEFEESLKNNTPLVDLDRGSASKGAGSGASGTGTTTNTPTTTPPATQTPTKCQLTAVEMVDTTREVRNFIDRGTRAETTQSTRRQEATADKPKSKIEVVKGSRLTLTATHGALCGQHETIWSMPEGGKRSGATITYTAVDWKGAAIGGAIGATAGTVGGGLAGAGAGGAIGGSTLGTLGAILGGVGVSSGQQSTYTDIIRLGDVNADVRKIVCACCEGTFDRQIDVYPNDVKNITVEPKGFTILKGDLFRSLNSKFGVKGDLQVLAVSIKVDAGWVEEADWRTTFQVGVSGGGTIIKGSLTAQYSFFDIPFPTPPPIEAVKWIIKAINWVYGFFKGGKLLDTYIRFTVEVGATFTIRGLWKKRPKESLRFFSLTGELAGSITITLALGVSALSTEKGEALVKGEVQGRFVASVAGILEGRPEGVFALPKLTVGPISVAFELSWNLMMLIPNPSPTSEELRNLSWWQRVKAQAGAVTRDAILKTIDIGMKQFVPGGMNLVDKKTWTIDLMKAETTELALLKIF